MADVSKLRLDNVSYDIKDDNARKYLVMVNEEPEDATKVVINTEATTYIELAEQDDVDKLQEKTNWIVTPEMYGAKGDGITDDTAAIQNALNTGNTVVFKKGATYLISTAIRPVSNQEVDLNGSTLNLQLTNNSSSPNVVINIIEKSHVIIHDGTLTTNYAEHTDYNTQVVGIHGDAADNCVVYDMIINNLGGPITPSGHTQITFSISTDTRSKDCYGNRIHDCTFNAIYDSFGVRFATGWLSVPNHEVYDNIVENCIFTYIEKSCVEIAGYKTHDCKALNNLVIDCGTEAMDIDKSAYCCEMSGNIVRHCSGSTEVPGYLPYGGISIQTYGGKSASVGYFAHDNVLTNNTIVSTVGAGFYVNGKNTIFTGNKVISAVRGLGLNSVEIDGNVYAPSGIFTDNVLNGTIYSILINAAEETVFSNNIISSIGTAIQAGSAEKEHKITNNIIHHGSYGLYAHTSGKLIFSDNTLIHDLANSNTTRAINALNVNYLRILNNTFTGITGTGIQINNSGTLDYTQLVNNKLPSGCAIEVIGAGTYSYLETMLNSVTVRFGNSTVISKWNHDLISTDSSIASENANFTLGSKAFVTTSGPVSKISLVGTIGNSIANNTKIASVTTHYIPTREQLIVGYIVTNNGVSKAVFLIENDGYIYTFSEAISAGTLYIDSTYLM